MKGFTQQEELNSVIADFNIISITPGAFEKEGGAAYMLGEILMEFAFFAENIPDTLRAQAVNYLNFTNFTSREQKVLDSAFIKTINNSAAKVQEGTTEGKEKDWLKYALKRNVLSSVKAPLANMPKWWTDSQIEVLTSNITTEEQEQGTVFGEETAERLQDIMRKKQLLGESIPLDEFRRLYDLALGASGRERQADRGKQFRQDAAEGLAALINSHLEKVSIKNGAYTAYNNFPIKSDLPGKADPATN